MMEIAGSIGAGSVWIGVFALLALAVRNRWTLSLGRALLAAYPVFFAGQVLLANLLGAGGLLTTFAFRVAWGGALLIGLVLCIRGGWWRISMLPDPDRADMESDTVGIRRVVLVGIGLLLASLALFTLVSPVHIWDALAYHMPMVASYVQNASLDAWPTQDLRQVYRVNGGELQMLAIALLAGSDTWVEVPNLLGLIVVLTATFELGRLVFRNPALPYLAALLVVTAPQIVIGAASEKNDLVFTAVLLCAFYWMIRAGRADEPRGSRISGYLLLAALSAALAGATKVMGLNVVGAVGLLALVLAVRRRLAFKHVLVFAGGAVAALLLLAGNVYLYNFGRTSVPVGIAPGEIHYTVGLANLIGAVRFYVFDLTLKRLVTRPVFEHDFMHYGYLFPLMLGLGVTAAIRQVRERRFVLASLALLGAALFLSIIAVRQPIRWDQRFMIWLVPTLAILALSLVERRIGQRALAVTWVAAVLMAGNVALVLTLESDRVFPRSALHLASTGTVARYLDVPNRRYPHMLEGLDVLNGAVAAGDSILYVGTDDSWMYPLWGREFSRHVEGVSNAEDAGARIASGHFRFLVVEAAADPAIRETAEAGAADSGYTSLVSVKDRTIFVRQNHRRRRSGSRRSCPRTKD